MSATTALLLFTAALVWPGRHRLAAPGRRPPGRQSIAGALARARRRGPGREVDGWVAEFAELAAIGLEAGLPAHDAVAAARRECAPAGVGARWSALERGGAAHDPAVALADLLRWDPRLGSRERDGLAQLLVGMRLSGASGAPLSVILRAQGGDLRARHAAAGRVRAAAAGPRATMSLLLALPAAAPLGTLAMGRGPFELYSTPVSAASGLTGVALAGLGWAWSRRILSRATREGRIGAPAPPANGQGADQ